MFIRSPKELGMYCKSKREKKSMNQTALGEKSGLQQKTISFFENKSDSAKLDTLFKILAMLDLDLYLEPKQAKPTKDQYWDEEW